jgi:hypothetical protein
VKLASINSVDGLNTDLGLWGSGLGVLIHAKNIFLEKSRTRVRPPFNEMEVVIIDDHLREEDLHRPITGYVLYKGSSVGGTDYLVYSCGNKILSASISLGSVNIRVLHWNIQSNINRTFFCQAGNTLFFQDGVNAPMYWRGSGEFRPIGSASGVEEPMPVGNIMVYAHGRIFLCDEEGIVRASNHINSKGFESNGCLDFSESREFTDGDGWGAYPEFGEITGAAVTRRAEDANGHGAVIIFQERGAFAIDPSSPRPSWASIRDIQAPVLSGFGAAPGSIVSGNGDIYYRSASDKGISSFRYDLSRESGSDRLSDPVSRYTDLDTQYSCRNSRSILHGKYLLTSIHGAHENDFVNDQTHSYCQAIAVFDTSTRKWSGMWDGVNPIGFVASQSGTIIISRDGLRNKFFSLEGRLGDDTYLEGGSRPINAEMSFRVSGTGKEKLQIESATLSGIRASSKNISMSAEALAVDQAIPSGGSTGRYVSKKSKPESFQLRSTLTPSIVGNHGPSNLGRVVDATVKTTGSYEFMSLCLEESQMAYDDELINIC